MNAKELAVASHVSQGGLNGYIGRRIHKDEFFWTEQFVEPLLSSPVPTPDPMCRSMKAL
jgi:hypothetical protein